MILYLIKNNLKLMLRSKWIIFVMVFGPILTIAILSSAFEDLLKTYEGTENFTVGYSISADSVFNEGINQVDKAGEQMGINFKQYPDGKPQNLIKLNNLAGFVELGQSSYTVYTSDDYVTEGITLKYFMKQVVNNIKSGTLQAVIPGLETEHADIALKEIEYMPAVNAKDYYGIVYIVYFIWCGIVCIASIFSSEKKNGIEKKYQVTSLSNTSLYFAKCIPAIIAITIEIAVTIVVSTIMFNINWGNIPITMMLLFLSVVASAAFSLMLYYILSNIAVTIIAVFSIVWFMAFFGGSFETYMFSSYPEFLKNLSPIYYINRTIVEYSCMGKSDYLGRCILYLSLIIAACTAVAIFIDTIRKRGRR